MQNRNRWLVNGLPYFFIIIFAIVILLPQMLSKTFIAGTDSLFHMNRFYETMMQIKTGHYSYFQSMFGFNQTGRIINALYGPIFAYINGLLLMFSGSWLRFQLINSFLALFLSGTFMYKLLIRNEVKRQYSISIAFIYMLSYPMMTWVSNQEFTGWGAALLPLLMLVGTNILRSGRIKTFQLALVVTILMQTHVMSTLIGCLALLPMVIVGWINSKEKVLMFKHAIGAVVITVLLTGNIWGSMLELFHSNYLMPVFPQIDMNLNAVSFQGLSLTFVGIVYTVIFLVAFIGLIMKWQRVDYVYKTIALVGFFFLFLSSQLFPWNPLAEWNLHVADVIQFPKRFLVIVFILLLLSFGMLLSLPKHGNHIKTNPKEVIVKDFLIFLAILIPLFQDYQLFNNKIQSFKSDVVVNQPTDKVYFNNKNPEELRKSFSDSNLEKPLNLFTKGTPDYLPIKEPITSLNQYYDLHPYRQTNLDYMKYTNRYQKTIHGNNQITLKWHGSYKHRITVPLAKYAHSEVTLNGKPIKHVQTSDLGAMQVISNKGKNEMTIRYNSSLFFKVIIWITMIAWIIVILILIL